MSGTTGNVRRRIYELVRKKVDVETTTADNGDLIINFSPTELEKLGWKEDDTINIIDNEDGTITLEKLKEE